MKIVFPKHFIKDYSNITTGFLSNSRQNDVFEVKEHIEKDEIIGVTIFNVDTFPHLMKIRKQYPKNKIIAGGKGRT